MVGGGAGVLLKTQSQFDILEQIRDLQLRYSLEALMKLQLNLVKCYLLTKKQKEEKEKQRRISKRTS